MGLLVIQSSLFPEKFASFKIIFPTPPLSEIYLPLPFLKRVPYWAAFWGSEVVYKVPNPVPARSSALCLPLPIPFSNGLVLYGAI